MPITLRGRIQKPTVFTSNSPALAYGFVNLISVFEKIPSSFYDWNASAAGSLGDSAMINPIYQSVALSTPLLAEYNETQKVDLIVTRQWLQTRLWKVVSDQVDSTCHQGAVVPLDLPITAGKSVMALMSTVAQKSADAHGIGIVSNCLSGNRPSAYQYCRNKSSTTLERLCHCSHMCYFPGKTTALESYSRTPKPFYAASSTSCRIFAEDSRIYFLRFFSSPTPYLASRPCRRT